MWLKISIFSSSFLRYISLDIELYINSLFLFNTSKLLFDSVLVSALSREKKLFFLSLFFALGPFEIFSLPLISRVFLVYITSFLCIYSIWIGFLNLWVDILHQFGSSFIFKYFFFTITFLFHLDSNYKCVRILHIVPHISNGLFLKKSLIFESHFGYFNFLFYIWFICIYFIFCYFGSFILGYFGYFYLHVHWSFPPLHTFLF